MTRKQFNLTVYGSWLGLFTLAFIAGFIWVDFIPETAENLISFALLAVMILNVVCLVKRLRETQVSAWFTLVCLIPYGMIILTLITSFLKDDTA